MEAGRAGGSGVESRSGLHASPLLVLTFALTCCVPWSCTEGAADGGWFLNFRIPFQKSILVTAQHQYNNQNFYMIVRGGTNVPLNFGGVRLWWLYWCREGWSTREYKRLGEERWSGLCVVHDACSGREARRGNPRVWCAGCLLLSGAVAASSRSPRLLG